MINDPLKYSNFNDCRPIAPRPGRPDRQRENGDVLFHENVAFAASTSLANGKWIVAGGMTGNNSIFGGDRCELAHIFSEGCEQWDPLKPTPIWEIWRILNEECKEGDFFGLFKWLDTLVGLPFIGVFPSKIKKVDF